MIVEDQSEVVAFLSRPEAFGDGAQEVERVETHISQIFIGRDRVFKLKRAVRFPYLDFSTLERRHESCLAEVAINRRSAPKLYKGVRAVRRGGDGTLSLDGAGEVIDWVVEMVRFDQDTLFDRLAMAGKLDRHMMDDLADVISAFHAHGEPRTDGGGRAGIARTIESDDNAYLDAGEGVLGRTRTKDLKNRLWDRLDQVGPLLEERRRSGCVRMCHGDLHLRNIFLMDGRPVLFDAIEFNNNFNIIDVLYDLAFLLMDLQYRGLGDLANIVMNRYLDITGASWGLGAMGLF
ncbi:phosphotransferase [Varunaivibrio sulfuroxidans]|nr:phosphotransferase [Varunaivibrio sulfuroxidans]WES30977.1 phosphotransferase [Varunaivibrio sulfuroxidans]